MVEWLGMEGEHTHRSHHASQDAFWDVPVVEICVDACAYIGGKPIEAIEALKAIYDYTGLKQLHYVDTVQGLREKANASHVGLLLALRDVMQQEGEGLGREEWHFIKFLREHHADWVDIVPTSYCNHFRNVMMERVIPEVIIPLLHATNGEAEECGQAFDRVQAHGFAILQRVFPQELQLHNIRSVADMDLAYAFSAEVKDTMLSRAVMQALRFQRPLWNRVHDDPRIKGEKGVHRNCADYSYLEYLMNKLPAKADAGARGFVLFTNDQKLMEDAASYTTGYRMAEDGMFRTHVRNQEYRQFNLTKRGEFGEYPTHEIVSNAQIAHFFTRRLAEVCAKVEVITPELAGHIERLEAVVGALEHEIAAHRRRQKHSGMLNKPYDTMIARRLTAEVFESRVGNDDHYRDTVRPSKRVLTQQKEAELQQQSEEDAATGEDHPAL